MSEISAAEQRRMQPIRCAVQVVNGAEPQTGVAIACCNQGLRLYFPPTAATNVFPGQILNLSSESSPLGPLQAVVHVTAVCDGFDHRGRKGTVADVRFVGISEEDRLALTGRMARRRPLVIVFGADTTSDPALRRAYRIVKLSRTEDLLRCLERDEVAVLVLGPHFAPRQAREILARCLAEFPGSRTQNIALCVGAEPELFQEFIDKDQVFYISRRPVTASQFRSIVTAAADRFQATLYQATCTQADAAATTDHILDFCLRLSLQTDLDTAGTLLARAAEALAHADRGYFLVYDGRNQVLCSKDPITAQERSESVTAGLVGFVARTHGRVLVEQLAADPRYDPEADNPGGSPQDHFLAQPVIGTNSVLLGVIAAVRDGAVNPFTSDDAEAVRLLAECAAPSLSDIAFRSRIEGLILKRAAAHTSSDVFCQQALDDHIRVVDQYGELLETPPLWLKRAHWLSIAVLFATLLFAVLGRIDEFATGPSVIRARNKINVTAAASGAIRSVEVSPGDRVRTGDLLVLLHSPPENAAVEHAPSQIRAPAAGVVSTVRVRDGQPVLSGDLVLSIIEDETYELVALLPGAYAPQLTPGMPLIMKIQGYPDSRVMVLIDAIAPEIVGPNEALRYVGRENQDAVRVTGPIVITRSVLRTSRFVANGRTYPYRDGMMGDAETAIHSEPILTSFIPGLKEILRK